MSATASPLVSTLIWYMADVEKRVVFELAGEVSGLTFRINVVPCPDLKAYRSVMSMRASCLAVGASR